MGLKDFGLAVLASLCAAAISRLLLYAFPLLGRIPEVSKALIYNPISWACLGVGRFVRYWGQNIADFFFGKRLSHPLLFLLFGVLSIVFLPSKVDKGFLAANEFEQTTPSIWPVQRPLYRPRNPFGVPYSRATEDTPTDAPVPAASAGKVILAGWQRGYGNVVYIDHGGGLTTRYSHLSKIDVTMGQTITVGQTIGRMGSIRRSIGPHLHFEVRVSSVA